MIRILLLHKEYTLKEIFFCLEWCYEHKAFSYEAVLMTLRETNKKSLEVEKIDTLYPQTVDILPNIAKYDKLMENNI